MTRATNLFVSPFWDGSTRSPASTQGVTRPELLLKSCRRRPLFHRSCPPFEASSWDLLSPPSQCKTYLPASIYVTSYARLLMSICVQLCEICYLRPIQTNTFTSTRGHVPQTTLALEEFFSILYQLALNFKISGWQPAAWEHKPKYRNLDCPIPLPIALNIRMSKCQPPAWVLTPRYLNPSTSMTQSR